MEKLPLGQLFVVGFQGLQVPSEARRMFVPAAQGGLGVAGAILFKRNIESMEQVVALNTELFELAAAVAGSPAHVVAVDQEGGRVARLRGIMTDVPAMRVVGRAAAGDEDLPYRLGAMMARELSALGFHWNFAPVVDVDTNPANPVIGERSFARDAGVVAQLAARFVEGIQQGGVAASAKHFPGHGDTDTDSHHDLPRLSHDMARLRAVELPPFQACIDRGVASVMTAHVMFPALDPDLPATLSPRIIDDLLRKELGYDGVVVSDDLEMAAVADRYPVEELVRLGLNAGVDLFLICHDGAKVAAAVEAAHKLVERGEIPRARVEQALRRVAVMKAKYVGAPAAPVLDEAKKLVRAAPHLALAERLAAHVGAKDEVRGVSPVDLG